MLLLFLELLLRLILKKAKKTENSQRIDISYACVTICTSTFMDALHSNIIKLILAEITLNKQWTIISWIQSDETKIITRKLIDIRIDLDVAVESNYFYCNYRFSCELLWLAVFPCLSVLSKTN